MIELINVSKYFVTDFGRHYVFRDVNLVLPLDKSVAVLGPNGAGKSTFLRLLGGADQPSTGTIVKTGRISPPMGLTPSLQPSLNGVENARFAGRIYGMERDEINEMIEYVKNLANIGKFFYMPVSTYSAGMRQRVAFAINMSMNFDYYLFDEIGAGGDREFRKVAKQMVRDRLKSSKFIMTSHNTGELLEICDSGIVIKDGELRFFDNVNDAVRFYGEDPDEELRRERDGAEGESERPRRRKRKKDKGAAPGDESAAVPAVLVESAPGADTAAVLPPPQSKAERRAARKAEAAARRRAKAEERTAIAAEAESERQARKAARAAASEERKARIAATRAAKLENPPKPRRGKKNKQPADPAAQHVVPAEAVSAAEKPADAGPVPLTAALPDKSADAAAREARRAALREQRLALRREARAAAQENVAAGPSEVQPATEADVPAAGPAPVDPEREARRAARRKQRLEQRAAAKAPPPLPGALTALPAPDAPQPADGDAAKSAARDTHREQRKAERREERRTAAKAQRVAERQSRRAGRAAGAPSPEGAPATPDNRRKRSGAADS